MNRILPVLFILLGLAMPVTAAFAQKDIDEGFARTTFRELVQTMVAMGGFDIKDTEVADEYIRIVYPRLFRKNFNNDVVWNDIRNQMVALVLDKKEYFRILYETTNVYKLGRYNFEDQSFPLFAKAAGSSTITTATKDVGFVTLFTRQELDEESKGRKTVTPAFPADIVMRIERPMTIDKINMPIDKVENLLARIEETGSSDRQIYGRTRVRITEALGLVRLSEVGARSALKGNVVSVDFFIDKDMTKWVGSATIPK